MLRRPSSDGWGSPVGPAYPSDNLPSTPLPPFPSRRHSPHPRLRSPITSSPPSRFRPAAQNLSRKIDGLCIMLGIRTATLFVLWSQNCYFVSIYFYVNGRYANEQTRFDSNPCDFRSRSKMYAEKNWQKKSRDEVNSKVSSSSSKLYFWCIDCRIMIITGWATKHHQRARMAADINWL